MRDTSPIIVTDCDVRICGTTQFTPDDRYLLPPDGVDGERLIAHGGKICYDTYGTDGNPVVNHVKNLGKQEHYSVMEHVNVSLTLTGISRGCSHEIVRHRHFSYSQRSTRYTTEESAAIVLEPYMASIYNRAQYDMPEYPVSTMERELLDDYLSSAWAAVNAYSRCVSRLLDLAPFGMSDRDKRKWARGKARQRLPHDLETRMVMTGNLRAWREFLIKRTSRHAEPEIRRLAQRIWLTIKPVAPAAFSDFTATEQDGFIELVQQSK